MLLRTRCAMLAALLAAIACDRPVGDAVAPRPLVASSDELPHVQALDIGVLPGDRRSEATYVTGDGTVYGYSYAGDEEGSARRAFRWTSGSGMQQVSSIPAPAPHPIPSVPVPAGGARRTFQANAKGEAVGTFCVAYLDLNCGYWDSYDTYNAPRGFRWTRVGGLQDLDLYRPVMPGDAPDLTIGIAINKWGHVAGLHQARNASGDLWRNMLWTPIDSIFPTGGIASLTVTRDRLVLLNDNDRVVSGSASAAGEPANAWEPGLGFRWLFAPGQTVVDDDPSSRALAQNNGRRIVGWTTYFGRTGETDAGGEPIFDLVRHAAVWDLPVANRAAFPTVNASPIAFTSTISLARTGGRYYQFYRGTQSVASGPYTELVDWGDGSSSTRTRPSLGTTTSQSHVYTRTGTYWVRVYLKDAKGRWGVAERRITVTS